GAQEKATSTEAGESIIIHAGNDIGIKSQQQRKIFVLAGLDKFQWFLFGIIKVPVLIVDGEYQAIVGRAIHRPVRLDLGTRLESGIAVPFRYGDHNVRLNTFLGRKNVTGPFPVVHEIGDRLLERLENTVITGLYLWVRDLHSAVKILG